MILATIDNLNQYPELVAFISAKNREEEKFLALSLKGCYDISLSSPTKIIARSTIAKIVTYASKPQGMSPYSIVSILGRYDLLDILLTKPLDEDDVIDFLCHVLPNAALGGNLKIIHWIIDALNRYNKTSIFDKDDLARTIRTSLTHAALNGHINVVHHLLQLQIANVGADFSSVTIYNCLKVVEGLIARNIPESTHIMNCFLAIPAVRAGLYRIYIDNTEPNYLLLNALRTGNQNASQLLLNDQILFSLDQTQRSTNEIQRGFTMDFTRTTLDYRSLETLILVLKQKQHPLGLHLNLRQANGTDTQRSEIQRLTDSALKQETISSNFEPGFFGFKNPSGNPLELNVGRQFCGYS